MLYFFTIKEDVFLKDKKGERDYVICWYLVVKKEHEIVSINFIVGVPNIRQLRRIEPEEAFNSSGARVSATPGVNRMSFVKGRFSSAIASLKKPQRWWLGTENRAKQKHRPSKLMWKKILLFSTAVMMKATPVTLLATEEECWWASVKVHSFTLGLCC